MIINNEIQTNTLQLTAEDRLFIDSIINRLTLFGQLQYKIPEKMIIECIKMAARFFYDNYTKAQYTTFIVIRKKDIIDFATENNTISSTGTMIKLNPRVRLVKDVYILNDGKDLASSYDLIQNIMILQHASPYNTDVLGINQNLYILEAACKMMEENCVKSVFGKAYPHNFSILTKELRLFDTIRDLVLECWMDVKLSVFYNDSLFDRYVYGICKRELRRLLASHTIPLPGDATINPDEICNNLEDIETVENIVKASSGIGDIMYIS